MLFELGPGPRASLLTEYEGEDGGDDPDDGQHGAVLAGVGVVVQSVLDLTREK